VLIHREGPPPVAKVPIIKNLQEISSVIQTSFTD